MWTVSHGGGRRKLCYLLLLKAWNRTPLLDALSSHYKGWLNLGATLVSIILPSPRMRNAPIWEKVPSVYGPYSIPKKVVTLPSLNAEKKAMDASFHSFSGCSIVFRTVMMMGMITSRAKSNFVCLKVKHLIWVSRMHLLSLSMPRIIILVFRIRVKGYGLCLYRRPLRTFKLALSSMTAIVPGLTMSTQQRKTNCMFVLLRSTMLWYKLRMCRINTTIQPRTSPASDHSLDQPGKVVAMTRSAIAMQRCWFSFFFNKYECCKRNSKKTRARWLQVVPPRNMKCPPLNKHFQPFYKVQLSVRNLKHLFLLRCCLFFFFHVYRGIKENTSQRCVCVLPYPVLL